MNDVKAAAREECALPRVPSPKIRVIPLCLGVVRPADVRTSRSPDAPRYQAMAKSDQSRGRKVSRDHVGGVRIPETWRSSDAKDSDVRTPQSSRC